MRGDQEPSMPREPLDLSASRADAACPGVCTDACTCFGCEAVEDGAAQVLLNVAQNRGRLAVRLRVAGGGTAFGRQQRADHGRGGGCACSTRPERPALRLPVAERTHARPAQDPHDQEQGGNLLPRSAGFPVFGRSAAQAGPPENATSDNR